MMVVEKKQVEGTWQANAESKSAHVIQKYSVSNDGSETIKAWCGAAPKRIRELRFGDTGCKPCIKKTGMLMPELPAPKVDESALKKALDVLMKPAEKEPESQHVDAEPVSYMDTSVPNTVIVPVPVEAVKDNDPHHLYPKSVDPSPAIPRSQLPEYQWMKEPKAIPAPRILEPLEQEGFDRFIIRAGDGFLRVNRATLDRIIHSAISLKKW